MPATPGTRRGTSLSAALVAALVLAAGVLAGCAAGSTPTAADSARGADANSSSQGTGGTETFDSPSLEPTTPDTSDGSSGSDNPAISVARRMTAISCFDLMVRIASRIGDRSRTSRRGAVFPRCIARGSSSTSAGSR